MLTMLSNFANSFDKLIWQSLLCRTSSGRGALKMYCDKYCNHSTWNTVSTWLGSGVRKFSFRMATILYDAVDEKVYISFLRLSLFKYTYTWPNPHKGVSDGMPHLPLLPFIYTHTKTLSLAQNGPAGTQQHTSGLEWGPRLVSAVGTDIFHWFIAVAA